MKSTITVICRIVPLLLVAVLPVKFAQAIDLQSASSYTVITDLLSSPLAESVTLLDEIDTEEHFQIAEIVEKNFGVLTNKAVAFNPVDQTHLVVFSINKDIYTTVVDEWNNVGSQHQVFSYIQLDEDLRLTEQEERLNLKLPDFKFKIAYNSNANEFLISWKQSFFIDWDFGSYKYGELVSQAYVQRISGDGLPLGQPQSFIDTDISDLVYNPVSDRYLAVWESSDSNIWAHFINAWGTPYGSPFPVITWSNSDKSPQLTVNTQTGEFLVAWLTQKPQPASPLIYVQRIYANGILAGGPIPINNSRAYVSTPMLTYNASANEYFVVWVKETTKTGEVCCDVNFNPYSSEVTLIDYDGRRLNGMNAFPIGPVYALTDFKTWSHIYSVTYDQASDRYLMPYNGHSFITNSELGFGYHFPSVGVVSVSGNGEPIANNATTLFATYEEPAAFSYDQDSREFLVILKKWLEYSNYNLRATLEGLWLPVARDSYTLIDPSTVFDGTSYQDWLVFPYNAASSFNGIDTSEFLLPPSVEATPITVP